MAHYFLIYPRYQKRCNRNSSLFLRVSFSELKPPDALLLFYSILVYSIEYTLPHVEASSRCCENSGELRAPSAKSNDKRTYHSFVMTYPIHALLLFGFRLTSYYFNSLTMITFASSYSLISPNTNIPLLNEILFPNLPKRFYIWAGHPVEIAVRLQSKQSDGGAEERGQWDGWERKLGWYLVRSHACLLVIYDLQAYLEIVEQLACADRVHVPRVSVRLIIRVESQIKLLNPTSDDHLLVCNSQPLRKQEQKLKKTADEQRKWRFCSYTRSRHTQHNDYLWLWSNPRGRWWIYTKLDTMKFQLQCYKYRNYQLTLDSVPSSPNHSSSTIRGCTRQRNNWMG